MKLCFCIPDPLLPHSHTLTKAICSSRSFFFLDALEEQVDATTQHFKNEQLPKRKKDTIKLHTLSEIVYIHYCKV